MYDSINPTKRKQEEMSPKSAMSASQFNIIMKKLVAKVSELRGHIKTNVNTKSEIKRAIEEVGRLVERLESVEQRTEGGRHVVDNTTQTENTVAYMDCSVQVDHDSCGQKRETGTQTIPTGELEAEKMVQVLQRTRGSGLRVI
ncbi:unnamed protein product [Callosobruchus maculatus]|uniref:Uncharacterized protein n=1 Tax=Callosobruchus maculatus TaxID=64391 RepID=A0A653C5B6_CALMS|nr:unnamed protein product [Callosobruchus maculatus]